MAAAAAAVVVVEARASIRSSSAAAAAFDSLGGVEGQVQLQGSGVEGSTGIRYWDWGKTPQPEQGVVEHSTVVERVAGDKAAHEEVHEGALEGEEVAAVEVVAAAVAAVVVDATVVATYTAQASDHTVQSSHTKNPGLVLRCFVAEAEDNIQDSRASSWVGTSAGTHTGMIQKAAAYHVQSDRKAQDSMPKARSGQIVPYKDQALKTHY